MAPLPPASPSMTKRQLVWIAAAGAVLGCAVIAQWWILAPSHGITYESASQLRHDMTMEELEALLRVPPGDYSTNPHAQKVREASRGLPTPREGYDRIEWLSDEVLIVCQVGRENGDIRLGDLFVSSAPVPLWQRTKRWLGL